MSRIYCVTGILYLGITYLTLSSPLFNGAQFGVMVPAPERRSAIDHITAHERPLSPCLLAHHAFPNSKEEKPVLDVGE